MKGLINTLISDVGEEFIASLKPKAKKLFFTSAEDNDALYFKGEVKERLTTKFKTELSALPDNTAFRKNGTWYIAEPNFARKDGRRVFWTSRIIVEFEAGSLKAEPYPIEGAYIGNPLTIQDSSLEAAKAQSSFIGDYSSYVVGSSLPGLIINSPVQSNPYGAYTTIISAPSEKRLVTHKGKDVYQVLWSTEVTLSKELKKATIDDITHVEMTSQPIA